MPSLCTDSILHTLFLVCANHSWIFAAGHGSRSSRAREFHPHPLTKPCVKVSPHTALHTQLFVHKHNLGVWPLCNAHHRNVSDCSSLQRGWCQCLHTDTVRPSLISLAVTATSYMEGSKPFIYRCAPRGTRTSSLQIWYVDDQLCLQMLHFASRNTLLLKLKSCEAFFLLVMTTKIPLISTFLKKISKIFCRFKKSLYFCAL